MGLPWEHHACRRVQSAYRRFWWAAQAPCPSPGRGHSLILKSADDQLSKTGDVSYRGARIDSTAIISMGPIELVTVNRTVKLGAEGWFCLTFDLTSVMAPNLYCLPMKAPLIIATMCLDMGVMSDKILPQDLVSLRSKVAGCWKISLGLANNEVEFCGMGF